VAPEKGPQKGCGVCGGFAIKEPLGMIGAVVLRVGRCSVGQPTVSVAQSIEPSGR